MDATPDPTKLAAFIMPGQGSQYVSMARDLSEKYKATRDVWHETETCITQFATGQHVPFASSHPDRAVYEACLVEQRGLVTQFRAPDTRLRRGWLTDLILGGSQLELNRQEKRCLLFLRLHHLSVIRKEFDVDVSKVIRIGRLAMVQVFMLHYWRQVCSSHAMRYA